MTTHNSLITYILITIFSIAILNCGSSSSGTTVPNGEPKPDPDPRPDPHPHPDPDPRPDPDPHPDPDPRPDPDPHPDPDPRPDPDPHPDPHPDPDPINYKFQNGVVEGVDFETNTGHSGTISSENGFTYDEGDERITFKIKNLIIGEFNLNNLNADKILLVNDIVGVERDDTINKDVLKMLRVLHSLDNDNDPSNGILINDTTKNKLINLSEGKTKITDNDIYELKALMVKAGKKLVVEKKARDYHKTNVLTPAGITPKFNPFTIEIETKSDHESFTFKAPTEFTYDYTVDWGDSSDIETGITGEKLHTYANAGTYTIKISGNFPSLNFLNNEKAKVTQILAWGDIIWGSFYEVFKNVNAAFHTTDTPDLSAVESMSNTFFSSQISDIDFINDWDVSNIRNMAGMFYEATSFNGNISNWDVSSVFDINSMFLGATSFNQDISDWDVGNVTNMNYMFNGASGFSQDLSGWSVGNVVLHSDFDKNWGAGSTPPNFNP